GSSPMICAASDQCHVAGTCNPSTGMCSTPDAPDGTTCDDGNACSQTDICQAGVCTAGNPVVCTALDQCHLAGTCDPATGACSTPAKPEGTLCDGGTCHSGACVPNGDGGTDAGASADGSTDAGTSSSVTDYYACSTSPGGAPHPAPAALGGVLL